MRISDWSSDVCSSDLGSGGRALSVGAAVLMFVAAGRAVPDQIDVRIVDHARPLPSNGDKSAIGLALVHEVMAVGRAHRKDGDVAWLHGLAAVILDHIGLAGQHDNELAFILMPVALGGPIGRPHVCTPVTKA